MNVRLYRCRNQDIYYSAMNDAIHFVNENRAKTYLEIRKNTPQIAIFKEPAELDLAVINFQNDWESRDCENIIEYLKEM